MAMPNGFGENKLPTSLQLNAAPANETTLLNVGIHYQMTAEDQKRVPAVFA
jgi:Asp-tRNA(Asn)/Glu-tRNA(Gln) amidotransferase A subunit family amidase